MKLSSSGAERDLYDSLAEVYSIIITLDSLEKAYIKDSVSEGEYTEICNRLLKQYKSSISDETVVGEFVDLETFKQEWDVCPHFQTEEEAMGLPIDAKLILADRMSSRHRANSCRVSIDCSGNNKGFCQSS